MTLTEAVSITIRGPHDSPRTETAYVYWVREFVRFHPRHHPRETGAAEVTNFLNDRAILRRASASTQKQTLCALLLLYRKELEIKMPTLDGLVRARRPARLPNVLSRREVQAPLERLDALFRLLAELLYGAGLHLHKSLSLRVKDMDLDRHPITVRRAEGAHDRAAHLSVRARGGLVAQLELVRLRHAAEREAGRGEVDPPHGVVRPLDRGHCHRRADPLSSIHALKENPNAS